MPTRPLYLLLLGCVLFLAGCGTESSNSTSGADSSSPPSSAADSAVAATEDTSSSDAALRVLILGNSIAAGSGVDSEEAFPALLQDKVDEQGWNVEIINGGVSGETTAGGLRRLDWLLRQPIDVLVIELGGNDGLRGTDLDATRNNLQAIIDKARDRYPDVHILLAGMQLPPNLGPDYTERFRALYPDLAEQNEATELISFLLEGVGGVDSLMQSDGIHPTAEGQRIVAKNVWAELEPMLQALLEERQAADA